MSSFKPEYLTFDDLLQKRFFEIPDYQRTYSWIKKQRQDLFNDIKKITTWRDKERHHFMATIVCLSQPSKNQQVGTTKFEKFDVVDGQQRLTTLIILLKAISKRLRRSIDQEKKEIEAIEEMLVKKDKQLILLQTNHDNLNIFRNYLENGVKPDSKIAITFTDKNMLEAFHDCENFVKNWQEEKDLLSLLSLLKNRLGFIFYTLEEPGSVYTIFEVLNSRGLDVDWLDKAKSMLMGFVHEKFNKQASRSHIKELHKSWIKIYQRIGLAEISGEEIVKFTATLLNENTCNKPLSAEESLSFFIDFCNQDKNNVFKIIDFIFSVTDKLKEIYLNRRQKAVTEIAQARLLAIAIKLSHFDKDEKNKLLDQWERVTFRIFGIFGKDSRTAVGDYVRLSKYVMDKNSSYRNIHQRLIELGSEYPVSKFNETLFDKNCYEGWQEELRYFFFRYEEFLAKKDRSILSEEVWTNIWRESPTKSIEHVFPQTPNEMDKSWKRKLGKGKNVIAKNVHRLGNLLLLTPNVNSQCYNKSFVDKKKIYNKQLLRLKDEIIRKQDWNLTSMESRERKLINWAKQNWCDI